MNEPARFVFDNKYLLRKPHIVDKNIMSTMCGESVASGNLILNFMDYRLDEVVIRDYYSTVNIEYFIAPTYPVEINGISNLNSWERECIVTINGLKKIRLSSHLSFNDIYITVGIFEYTKISSIFYHKSDSQRTSNINKRLLWRPDGNFENIRHWYRLVSNNLDYNVKHSINWKRDGF